MTPTARLHPRLNNQLIVEPTRTTERFKKLIDYILSNSPVKVSRKMLLKTDYLIMNHLLIKETSFLKFWEHYEISLRPMKNYSDEIFVEQLKSIKFPEYSIFAFMNDAYRDLGTKFLSVIDFVAPITDLRMRSNNKPWFDICGLNAICNRDKHQSKFERLDKEIDKGNFKHAKFLLKKEKLDFLIIGKNVTLTKKLWKIRII